MSGGLGMLGFIGLGKEGSGNVAVAASTYFEALSESVSLKRDRIERINLGGRISEPDDYQGASTIEGEISFSVNPSNIGFPLLGILSPASLTEVLSGSLYTHAFAPPTDEQTQWDAYYAGRPFTMEIYRDVGSSQQYAGVNFAGLTLQQAWNQDLRATAQVIATSERDIAKSTPTFATSPTDPFGFDACSVSIAGVAATTIEALTINMMANLEGVGTLHNSRNIKKIRRNNFFQPRFELTAAFEDNTFLNRLRNQSEFAMTVTWSRANSFQLVWHSPRSIITSFPTGVGGRGRQVITMGGMSRYSVGSGLATQLLLTTTVNSF